MSLTKRPNFNLGLNTVSLPASSLSCLAAGEKSAFETNRSYIPGANSNLNWPFASVCTAISVSTVFRLSSRRQETIRTRVPSITAPTSSLTTPFRVPGAEPRVWAEACDTKAHAAKSRQAHCLPIFIAGSFCPPCHSGKGSDEESAFCPGYAKSRSLVVWPVQRKQRALAGLLGMTPKFPGARNAKTALRRPKLQGSILMRGPPARESRGGLRRRRAAARTRQTAL
jgi:hypothetical protein